MTDEAEQRRNRAEQRQSRAEQRRGQRRAEAEARQQRENPAEFRAMSEETREPELAVEARSFIGDNQVRVVIVATRTQRKVHIQRL